MNVAFFEMLALNTRLRHLPRASLLIIEKQIFSRINMFRKRMVKSPAPLEYIGISQIDIDM